MKNKPAKLISTASECNVRVFMLCAYGKDKRALVISGQPTEEAIEAAWMNIYTEYVDLSGMIQTMEFDLMKTILYLDCRVKKITLLLKIQHESLEKIGVPCVGAFDKIKTYGHRFIWDPANPDVDAFKRMLINIASREKKYEIELAEKIKELLELKKKEKANILPEIERRKEFVRSLTRLEKNGYRIDKDKTSVEELGLMIHDHNDAAEKDNYSPETKRR